MEDIYNVDDIYDVLDLPPVQRTCRVRANVQEDLSDLEFRQNFRFSKAGEIKVFYIYNFSDVEYCALPQLSFWLRFRFRFSFKLRLRFRFRFRLRFRLNV